MRSSHPLSGFIGNRTCAAVWVNRMGLPRVRTVSAITPFFSVSIPWWKRMTDVCVSSVLIFLFLPLFAAIALLIKAVSPGPVLYRQERVGAGGRRFLFLKFRTMTSKATDPQHCQYLKTLIAGSETGGEGKPMCKLDPVNPHIIPLGHFLRSTCLDELPQLFNVLRGEMSLVGPRPPIPYEVEVYKTWHSNRFNCLPGMTGLWQVSGKNRLTFKEMVRLDIRYARTMSFWLDLKILFLTPYAIVREIVLQRKSGLQRSGE